MKDEFITKAINFMEKSSKYKKYPNKYYKNAQRQKWVNNVLQKELDSKNRKQSRSGRYGMETNRHPKI